jgi:hypothetical protein
MINSSTKYKNGDDKKKNIKGHLLAKNLSAISEQWW